MKRIVLNTPLIAAVIALIAGSAWAEEIPKHVPIAFWSDLPEVKIVGTRVGSILRTHDIEFSYASGCGITAIVPAEKVSAALRVLAQAIEDEKLPVTLLIFKEGRYIHVSPSSVLAPKTNKSTQ